MISIVTPDSIDYVWERMRPQIRKALGKGVGQHYTEQYYYQQVIDGKMQMWAMHDVDVVAMGIISIVEYPKAKSLFIEVLAGERLDDWLDLVEPLLEEYAAKIGATTIEALCRPGLVKKLKRWRPVATLMRLDNGRKQQT